jgi:polyferredoxin
MKMTGIVFAISVVAAVLSYWRELQHFFAPRPFCLRIVSTFSDLAFELSGLILLCLLAILLIRRIQRA